MEKYLPGSNVSLMLQSLIQGQVTTFAKLFQMLILNVMSVHDLYKNRLIPKKSTELGIVIEFKKVDEDEKEDLEKAAQAALQQIKEKKYEVELSNRGISRIITLGIAFQGKQILVKQG